MSYETVKPHHRNSANPLPFDVPMLLIVASLLVIGLLMVYSSSWDASMIIDKPATYVFTRQVMWVALGIAVAFVLSLFDYHKYEKLLVWIMMGILALLIAVLVQSEVRFNSKRSLLNGSIQPAEFAKFAIVIYLAFWLNNHRDDLHELSNGLIPLAIIIGSVATLIILQPDISAAGTIMILGVLMFFLAGGSWKQLILIMFTFAIFAVIAFSISSTAQLRMQQYISGLQNPVEGSYHVRRTFEAIIKGGVFGVGLGKADTKFTGLPLPHTDSIFAVLTEETGLIGALVVIILYALLIWRGLTIAKKAPDRLGSLIAFGLTAWIVLEAFINISVIVGLFPFAGNALPFISAGGSSMVASMAAIGITMNVARQGVTHEAKERSQTSATVDLRGRDWRRGVPGANRFGDFTK